MAADKCCLLAARLLIFTLFLILGFEVIGTFAKGARGGGFRSSSGYRSSSSYRAPSYSSTRVRYGGSSSRVRVRYSNRPWYGSGPRYHVYAVHNVYGYPYYTRTSYYSSHRDREPTTCHNEWDYLRDNGTAYEWFICPTMDMTSDYHYCCGEEDREYCCRFQDSGGRVFGVIAGILLFFGSIALMVYCCCWRKPTGKQPFFQERVLSRRSMTYRSTPNVKYSAARTIPQPMDVPMVGPHATFPQEPLYPVMPPQDPNDQGAYPFYPQNPEHPPNQGYQTDPGYPPNPGYPSQPSYPPNPGYPLQPDYPPNPGYPPQSDYPPNPGYPPSEGYPLNPGHSAPVSYPTNPGYPPEHGGMPMPYSGGYEQHPLPSYQMQPPDMGPGFPVSPPPPYAGK